MLGGTQTMTRNILRITTLLIVIAALFGLNARTVAAAPDVEFFVEENGWTDWWAVGWQTIPPYCEHDINPLEFFNTNCTVEDCSWAWAYGGLNIPMAHLFFGNGAPPHGTPSCVFVPFDAGFGDPVEPSTEIDFNTPIMHSVALYRCLTDNAPCHNNRPYEGIPNPYWEYLVTVPADTGYQGNFEWYCGNDRGMDVSQWLSGNATGYIGIIEAGMPPPQYNIWMKFYGSEENTFSNWIVYQPGGEFEVFANNCVVTDISWECPDPGLQHSLIIMATNATSSAPTCTWPADWETFLDGDLWWHESTYTTYHKIWRCIGNPSFCAASTPGNSQNWEFVDQMKGIGFTKVSDIFLEYGGSASFFGVTEHLVPTNPLSVGSELAY